MRGHIRQRAKGSWSIVVELGRDPATGKRRQQWHTVRGTKKDAERVLRELTDAAEKGIQIKPHKLTLGEHLQQWLDGYVKLNCSLRTLDGYESNIRCHIAPDLGRTPLNQLRPQQIEKYYARLMAPKEAGGKALTSRTVLHIHRVLFQALKQAVRQGLLLHNPAGLVDAPRTKKRKMRTLTPHEVARFLTAAKTDPYYPVIYTAVNTGLRQGELLGLRWRDVDLDLASLSVSQVLYKRRGVCIFKEPKSEYSRRRIDLTPSLALFLRQYRAQRESERLILGKPLTEDDLVFMGPHGTPVDPGTLQDHHSKIVKSAGLPGTRFHDLRHTFASLMLLAGVHPKVVSEMLGHSSVAFTLDTYSHVIGGLQKAAMQRLDEVLQPKLTQIEGVSKPLAENGDLDSASGQSRTDDRRFTKPLLYH
jgi:integrase